MRAFRKVALLGSVLILMLGLGACDRKVQVYEPGVYKGAPLTAPWDSPQFGGQTAAWERAIETRTLNQNEYRRMQSQ